MIRPKEIWLALETALKAGGFAATFQDSGGEFSQIDFFLPDGTYIYVSALYDNWVFCILKSGKTGTQRREIDTGIPITSDDAAAVAGVIIENLKKGK
jgi:hypothetical protein